jgi:hypothetical protein
MLPRGVRRAVGCVALVAILSACQQSVQGQKLDTNYATTNGIGSTTGTPVKLPHGRYTFFSSADPATCVTSVALLNQEGHPVVDDATQRAAELQPPPGAPAGVQTSVNLQMLPTMVQQELPSGSYRLKVTTNGAGCAWQIQQILNYMLSNDPPLKPAVPPLAPALHVQLGNSSPDRTFHVDVPGIYTVEWGVTPCDKYSGDLIRRDGGMLHLGDGQAMALAPGSFVGPQVSSLPTFLGAGDWTARVTTRCYWTIQVTPLIGPNGGGVQGFSR